MGYKVSLLDPAYKFLIALTVKERQDLARVLLTLKKNPRPEGSRKLEPSLTEPVPGGYLWERLDWLVTFKLDEEERTVDIGTIEKSP